MRSTASPVSPIAAQTTNVSDARGDRDVEEHRGGAVGERLRARSRCLRLADEALDARERRVVADGLDPDPHRAVGRDRAGDDAVAGGPWRPASTRR